MPSYNQMPVYVQAFNWETYDDLEAAEAEFFILAETTRMSCVHDKKQTSERRRDVWKSLFHDPTCASSRTDSPEQPIQDALKVEFHRDRLFAGIIKILHRARVLANHRIANQQAVI
jgi:hypothetical protein